MTRVVPWLGLILCALGVVLVLSGGGLWIWLALLGVGLALGSVLLSAGTVLERLGLAVLLGELVFLFLTLLRHAAGYPFTVTLWYPVGALVISGLVVLLARDSGAFPIHWFGRDDVITVLLGVLLFAYGALVFSQNGYQRMPEPPTPSFAGRGNPDGREQYVMRGFLNGDTATLFALTWRAQDTGKLNRENPFAGNGPLEYPTLLHGALGILLGAVNGDITRAAWFLVIPPLFGTLAALTSLFRVLGSRGDPLLWGLVGGATVLFYGWEAFVYPQSHTFLMGLFLLCVLLLLDMERSLSQKIHWLRGIAAWIVALVLLFSNAVLGTAAVAVFTGVGLLRIREKRPWHTRLPWVIGAASLLVLFLAFPPGEGGLGRLNVPYTAFPSVAMLLLSVLLVLRGISEETRQHPAVLVSMAVVLPALTVVTMFFSRRDIVADNASRFLYLFLFASWPIAVGSLRTLTRSWLASARDRTRGLQERLILWIGLAVGLVALVLPGAATVARTTDSLLRSQPQVVSPDELAAFSWIRSHTSTDAVFLRAPERLFEDLTVAPLGLPAFTGRAQVRADFWLSSDDAVSEKVQEFFQGEDASPPRADYLFCGPERLSCPDGWPPLFHAGNVSILPGPGITPH